MTDPDPTSQPVSAGVPERGDAPLDLNAFAADIGRHLTEARELPEMLRRCTQSMVDHLHAAFARIWTLDPGADVLELCASSGMYVHLNGPHGRIPVGQFKIGLIASERQPHLTNHVLGDPRVPEQAWAREKGLVAFAGYPLVVDDRLVGVMAMFSRQTLSERTLEAMASMARHIALGIERKRAEDALRLSEEAHRLAIEGAQLGTFYWEMPARRMHWSVQMKAFFFLPPDAEITPDLLMSRLHPEDREPTRRALEEALAGRANYQTEYRVLDPRNPGRVRWLHATGRGFHDAATGELTRFHGITADITQRVHAEQATRVARDAAEAANRAKDEFLATLSHELRTPLNAILGWTQILRLDGPTDAVTWGEGLDVVERNTRSQVQLIEDILDVSRIVSGKLRLDVRSVSPDTVLRAALDAVRPAADSRAIRLECVLDPHAGPITGDPDRLQQVFWNLLSNAIKFTPKGGRVQVSLARVNSAVEFTVADSGEGIAAEFLPHVFERFQQADSSSTRTHKGLGLGLAIVRHLVELHGGTIQAASAGVGQGSTFGVQLPVALAHQPATLAPGAAPREHPTAEDTGRRGSPLSRLPRTLAGIRIVAVDDDAESRVLLQRILTFCGADVTVVETADEAARAVEQLRPDVLLSDIEMPGEDGYMLIARVRALGPERGGNTPAAALTAYARAEDRTRALMAGFQLHVPKPVEPLELVAVVTNLAGRRG